MRSGNESPSQGSSRYRTATAATSAAPASEYVAMVPRVRAGGAVRTDRVGCSGMWLRCGPAGGRLFLFDRDLVQADVSDRILLQLNHVLLLVEAYLIRQCHAAFALSLLRETDFEEGERVIDRARLIAQFPEAHITIGGDQHALAAVGQRLVPRVAQVPAKTVVVRVGTLPVGQADASLHRRLLQPAEQIVLPFLEHRA